MPAQREPLPIVAAAFGLLTAGLLAARAFGVPVEWEVILTAAGIGGLDTARSLLGAGVKALRPAAAPLVDDPEALAAAEADARQQPPRASCARAVADALIELHAAAGVKLERGPKRGAEGEASAVQVRDLVDPDALAVALRGAYYAGGDPSLLKHRPAAWADLPANEQLMWGAAALLAHDLAAGKPAAARRFAYLLAEAGGAYPWSGGSLPPAPVAPEPAE